MHGAKRRRRPRPSNHGCPRRWQALRCDHRLAYRPSRKRKHRLACDTGGTFTDLVVERSGEIRQFKSSTVPADPVQGVLDALGLAAAACGLDRAAFLAEATTFIHGTTHAINAILTGNTARTAFLTTQGHPDVLVIREGGRIEPFNFTVPYPEPYVPKRLTFEMPGRIDAATAPHRPASGRGRRCSPSSTDCRPSRSRRSASAFSGQWSTAC
ncbi:MAG: hydantoinase/oxoprolinase N-terminal domain-containing protein [Geminicoccaceae bacterium]